MKNANGRHCRGGGAAGPERPPDNQEVIQNTAAGMLIPSQPAVKAPHAILQCCKDAPSLKQQFLLFSVLSYSI